MNHYSEVFLRCFLPAEEQRTAIEMRSSYLVTKFQFQLPPTRSVSSPDTCTSPTDNSETNEPDKTVWKNTLIFIIFKDTRASLPR